MARSRNGATREAETTRPILYLNGKFYSGATNGVHRVADRLIRELDRMADSGKTPAGWDMRLLLPARDNWAPQFATIRPLRQRMGHSQLWEQTILPIIARDGTLLCLANLSPWMHRRKITMVHDAQFRISPESYPPKLRFGYRAIIPISAQTSLAVLTVSGYARDTLSTFGIAKPRDTTILYNGADHILQVEADHRLLADQSIETHAYCLLFGATARYKNLKVVLDAFQQTPTDLRLVIIGPSRNTLAKAGLFPPPSALFVGVTADSALRSLYERAHCLLYPSRTEGFGLPPVEAMLCGCPVVAAPAGAIPEISRDAVTYAAMDDPREWSDAIQMLGEPSYRAGKIAAGRARAQGFTWRAAGEALVRALLPILEPASV